MTDLNDLSTLVPAGDDVSPGWLTSARRDALDRAVGAGLPTDAEEVWRYSPIDDLDLATFTSAPTSPAPPLSLEAFPPVDGQVASATLIGAALGTQIDPRAQAAGLQVLRLADAPDGADVLAGLGEATDAFGDLALALAADPILIRVARGVEVPGPVVVDLRPLGQVEASLLVIDVGDDAAVDVVCRVSTAPDAAPVLVLPRAEVRVGQAARVSLTTIQDLGDQAWQIGSQVARVGSQATYRSATASLGGGYARLRTDCHLDGRGASSTLDAVWFGDGDQTHDFRTFQDHAAPDTTSDLLYKGALGDRSRSVYSGLIRVRPEAKGTRAFQTNRNVKLSEEAWAESVPNLEIQTNDVQCSHASAMGPIDEEQRFYLESRGVPPTVAERLVLAGFFDEVLARFALPVLAGPVRDRIATKLARQGLVA